MAECILCGGEAPRDTRWWLLRVVAPRRFPRCWPATPECYLGLCDRIGATPTPEHLAEMVADANRTGRRP